MEGRVDGDWRGEDVEVVEQRLARFGHELERQHPLVESRVLQKLPEDDHAEREFESKRRSRLRLI